MAADTTPTFNAAHWLEWSYVLPDGRRVEIFAETEASAIEGLAHHGILVTDKKKLKSTNRYLSSFIRGRNVDE